jgi:hypothetical protein
METTIIIILLIGWVISLFILIAYYVGKDDPAKREQNDMRRHTAYINELKTKHSVWQRGGTPRPGKEFSPVGKGIWAWIILTLIGTFVLSGLNFLIAIFAMICCVFISEGMGWKNSG